MLNTKDLSKFLKTHAIEAEILFLEEDTPTVTAAAAVLGVQPAQIIKSVLFLADEEPVLVIANGLTRIDSKRLADYLDVSRRRVKLARPAQVLAHTGYVAGSVPPFGHRQALRTVLETAVTRVPYPHIYGGGGEIHALLKLTPATLQQVVGNEIADLAE